jgi:hypothetical protein
LPAKPVDSYYSYLQENRHQTQLGQSLTFAQNSIYKSVQTLEKFAFENGFEVLFLFGLIFGEGLLNRFIEEKYYKKIIGGAEYDSGPENRFETIKQNKQIPVKSRDFFGLYYKGRILSKENTDTEIWFKQVTLERELGITDLNFDLQMDMENQELTPQTLDKITQLKGLQKELEVQMKQETDSILPIYLINYRLQSVTDEAYESAFGAIYLQEDQRQSIYNLTSGYHQQATQKAKDMVSNRDRSDLKTRLKTKMTNDGIIVGQLVLDVITILNNSPKNKNPGYELDIASDQQEIEAIKLFDLLQTEYSWVNQDLFHSDFGVNNQF